MLLTKGRNDLAETDFKVSIAGMFDSLPDDKKYPYGTEFLGWPNTGVLIETGDKNELVSLLNLLTGRDFLWDDHWDLAEKKRRIEDWKQWWEKQGRHQSLNLEAIKERYNIG